MLRLFANTVAVLCFSLLCVNACAFDFEPEMLQQDKEKIKNHIFKIVAKDIETSETWWIKATCAYRVEVTDQVYNSRPLAFFDAKKEAKKIFEIEIDKPEVAIIVQQGITEFLQVTNGKVSRQNLGSVYHNKLVNYLSIEEAKKEELKNSPDPEIMRKFLRETSPVVCKQYMEKNVHNLIEHYYLTTKYHK